MVAKFFFLALIGVALAQNQVVEDFIERGLARANGLLEKGERKIADAVEEVRTTRNVIQLETAEFLKRSEAVQAEVKNTLRAEAELMEQKANELQKPSALQCIRVAEENANNRVGFLTNRFKNDMERLQQTKLGNIETDSRPLDGMPEALRVRYERATKQVVGCKGEGCVETANNSFEVWVNKMISDIDRVLGQVSKVYSNFNNDANNYFDNAYTQIDSIKNSTSRNIRICV